MLVKLFVIIGCISPAGIVAIQALRGNLGANPIEAITHATGIWALRFLLLTLAVTPIRKLFRWSGVARFRRILGLTAFAYALLHFLTYLVLDHFFDFPAILEDVTKRRFITAGFAAFLILLPLAITSTNGMIRRIGGRRWQKLHRLIYLAAVAACVHFIWLVKADLREPLIYMGLLSGLLGIRIYVRFARTKT